MLGWLFYLGELTDCDLGTVVAQHEERVGKGRGRLTPFFGVMYEQACMYRLADRLSPLRQPRDGLGDGVARA